MSQFRSVHDLNGVDSIDRSLQAETFAFKCGKCGQSKTRYYQMQTRSADEPMTVCTFGLSEYPYVLLIWVSVPIWTQTFVT